MATQKVNFDDIATSCGNLTNLASSMDETNEVIHEAVNGVKPPTWGGTASEAFVNKAKKLIDNLPEANRQLALSVLFLSSCADGYEKLGQDSVKLLKDIIGGQDYIDKYDVNSAPTPDLTARIADTYGKDPAKSDDKDKDTDTGNQNTGNRDTNNNYTGGNNTNSTSSGGNTNSYYGGVSGASGLAAGLTGGFGDTNPTENKKDVKDKVKKIGHVSIDQDKLTDKGKELFKNEKFAYKDGYAKIGDYYLITCDSSIGNVGDVVKFTLKDGKTVTCIIAANSSDSGTINFIVEKDKLENFSDNDTIKNLIDNSDKIENSGNCQVELGISTGNVNYGNIDMNNYPTDVNSRSAALDRGTLVAKYLMQNGGFTAEQAAALAGVYVDENGCYPGEMPGQLLNDEKAKFGDGYGAGIGSWTTSEVKHTVLSDAGFATNTPIESLSLQQQCDMIIATSNKSNKTYYNALRRCSTLEDASATATVMTGGVGFSSNWSTHPTQAEAKAMADYYAAANDRTYGYSEYHHNADTRRLETAREIYQRLV